MTNATRNKTQGVALRKQSGHPWRAWNPGSLVRSDYLPAPERKHNPKTPTHGACEVTSAPRLAPRGVLLYGTNTNPTHQHQRNPTP